MAPSAAGPRRAVASRASVFAKNSRSVAAARLASRSPPTATNASAPSTRNSPSRIATDAGFGMIAGSAAANAQGHAAAIQALTRSARRSMNEKRAEPLSGPALKGEPHPLGAYRRALARPRT